MRTPRILWAIETAYGGDIRVVDDTMIYKQDVCDPPLFEAGAAIS